MSTLYSPCFINYTVTSINKLSFNFKRLSLFTIFLTVEGNVRFVHRYDVTLEGHVLVQTTSARISKQYVSISMPVYYNKYLPAYVIKMRISYIKEKFIYIRIYLSLNLRFPALINIYYGTYIT